MWSATTGISAYDRAAAIRALADPRSSSQDFTQPGRVFPLAAVEGGVLARPGHTEASVELAVAAGAGPAAVICEIAAADGSMARLPALMGFAKEHGLLCVSIEDLIDIIELILSRCGAR
jgi:3,4-dihydroxy 2-butanone 4-phosphate synthase/GTP cyclohydrolase II